MGLALEREAFRMSVPFFSIEGRMLEDRILSLIAMPAAPSSCWLHVIHRATMGGEDGGHRHRTPEGHYRRWYGGD